MTTQVKLDYAGYSAWYKAHMHQPLALQADEPVYALTMKQEYIAGETMIWCGTDPYSNGVMSLVTYIPVQFISVGDKS